MLSADVMSTETSRPERPAADRFVVLDGAVDMHYRADGREEVELLTPGRICIAGVGDEHVAHPQGPARILVVEKQGSV